MTLDDLRQRLAIEGSLTLTLRVRPKTGENRVRGVQSDGILRVDVKSLPEDGEANADAIAVLAAFFDVAKSSVTLLSGHRSRTKIIRIG